MRKLSPFGIALALVLLPIALGAAVSVAGSSGVITGSCGDIDASGSVTSGDALKVLRTAVGLDSCDDCLCDAKPDGKVSAVDALSVLQAAVGLERLLECPLCASARFRIASEMTCTGTRVVIPSSALPEGLSAEHCAIGPRATSPACEAELEIDDEGLVVDVRHSDETPFDPCDLGATLFGCNVTPDEADEMIAAASVACPCNCALVCPPFALCNDVTGQGCIAATQGTPQLFSGPEVQGNAAPVATVASPLPVPTTVVTGSTVVVTGSTVVSTTHAPHPVSTSTTFCGTCCNMDELGELEIPEPPPVMTELLLRVSGETTPHGCLFCYSDVSAPGREMFMGHEDEDSALICIVDHGGITDAGRLALCEGYGQLQFGAVEVLRASGINFEPVDSLPAVNLNEP